MEPATQPKRPVFACLSIPAGNALQTGGILTACFCLREARSAGTTSMAVPNLLLAWILLYFSCHAIAHWMVGRIVGIRFRHYTVGGTANPELWPRGARWIFEHLPFFGVQTEKLSMQSASPRAKALMWSAGVTASATIPAWGVIWAALSGVPASRWFLLFALPWSCGTFASNWRSRSGDYAKARRALAGG
jgi:hypothetical protein